MTSTTAPARTVRHGMPWWTFGIANVAVVAILGTLSWWLLVDPAWSPFGAYPQPYTAMLFWTIISTVWLAFTFGWTGPAGLPQPLRGLAAIATSVVIGVGITLLLAGVYGSVDPTFAASRPEGTGFTAGNLVVLFAFFFYVTAAVNWEQWPWAGLPQPLRGLGELALPAIPTVALYALLVLPNLAVWGDPATAVFSIATLIGWVYSVIVAVVVTGVLLDNRPWSSIRSPGLRVAVSLVGNIVIGTGIYYLNLGTALLLLGRTTPARSGPA
ncbi:hypothetical protein [Pseudonocardia spirodelae]|uniref:Tryptophan-rich sensory protein n=1 Tax=Pseudonocardia spirodelae TaxID=3133431 RepID=A0ABU8TCW2_9PSEU